MTVYKNFKIHWNFISQFEFYGSFCSFIFQCIPLTTSVLLCSIYYISSLVLCLLPQFLCSIYCVSSLCTIYYISSLVFYLLHQFSCVLFTTSVLLCSIYYISSCVLFTASVLCVLFTASVLMCSFYCISSHVFYLLYQFSCVLFTASVLLCSFYCVSSLVLFLVSFSIPLPDYWQNVNSITCAIMLLWNYRFRNLITPNFKNLINYIFFTFLFYGTRYEHISITLNPINVLPLIIITHSRFFIINDYINTW